MRTVARLFACVPFVVAAVACGGTEDTPRPTTKPPKTFPPDPGSRPVDCGAEDGYEFKWIEDWETGAGTGWYFGNEYCQDCTEMQDEIDQLERPVNCLKGTATGCTSEEDLDSARDILGGKAPNEDDLSAAIAEMKACYATLPTDPEQDCSGSDLFERLLGRLLDQQEAANAVRTAFNECVATQCAPTQNPPPTFKPAVARRIPNGRCDSQYAMHVEAPFLERRGGTVGRQFSPTSPFDATAYDGIAFWLRVAPGSRGTLRLSVPESQTEERSLVDGEPVCVFIAQNKEFTDRQCDKFGRYFLATYDWQLFRIPFDELRQSGFGRKAPFFNVREIMGMSLDYRQGPWSIWLDDIGFYRKKK